LVRGLRITTDFDGDWEAEFPIYEVPLGTSSLGAKLTLNVPSAFHLFIANSDWQGAYQITIDFRII